MELKDLLEKPLSEMTDEQLAQRISALKRMRLTTLEEKSPSSKPRVTNEDKRIMDLLSSLTPEQKEMLAQEMKGESDG